MPPSNKLCCSVAEITDDESGVQDEDAFVGLSVSFAGLIQRKVFCALLINGKMVYATDVADVLQTSKILVSFQRHKF